MTTKSLGIIAAIAALALGCSGNKDDGNVPKKPPPKQPPAPETQAPEADGDKPGAMGVSGRHRAGDDNKSWVPAEYKQGRGKWKDAGVYLDGKPLAILWFGELPSTLEPIWLDDWEMLEFKAGHKGPKERKIKVRRYRVAEYFEALGVDLSKVKELHLFGGRGFPAIIKGSELRKHRDDFHFSFGRETSGKPLVLFPAGMKVNTTFDHITGIMLYIDKQPPKMVSDGELELNGKIVDDVPYFGEPLRGGVRVYLDDRMATIIKRRKLEGADKLAEKGPDGTLRWKLFPWLESRGVDTSKIVAAEVVFHEKRETRLTREQLVDNFFTANPQASGRAQLGEQALPMQALALYTKPLPERKPDVPPPVDP